MEKEKLDSIIEKLKDKPNLESIKKEFEFLEADDAIYVGNMVLSNIATRALENIKCDSEVIILLRDIVNKANKEMKELATKDPLTKLHNRNQLTEAFKQEQSRMSRDSDYVISLLIVDIDHFKKFNDEYGHVAGDEVLKNFSKVITENIRGTDGAFRYGGEEFIVLYSGTIGKEAHRAAKYLKSYMADFPMEFTDENDNTHEKIITFSGGVTQVKKDETLKDAIERADKLLYQAKETGRNNIIWE